MKQDKLQRLLRLRCLNWLLLVFATPCPGQAPVFTNAMVRGDGLAQTQLKTVVGQSYTIEISMNLANWTNVGSYVNVTTNLLTLVDPRPVANFSRMFYRARLGVDVLFDLSFHEFAQAGHFSSGFTPVISYPVTLNSYAAVFDVQNDASFPSATNVFFSGPAGSGLSNTQADANNSQTNSTDASYQSPNVSSPPAAPGGTWTVRYKGTNHTYNIADPQAAARLVVPVPTVAVSGDVVLGVSWVYKDANTGATLGGAPAYLTRIQVQFDGYVGGRVYNSPNLGSGVTGHTLSSTVNWSNISTIYMAYDDTLDNSYIVSFAKP